MIAIDTNVLLRYLLDDDAKQSKLAQALIRSHEKVLIVDAVLVETLWTLKGKKYGLSKDELIEVVNVLFEDRAFLFENNQIVWRALHNYKSAASIEAAKADFSDALIVEKARFVIEKNGQGFEGLFTFDKGALKLDGAHSP